MSERSKPTHTLTIKVPLNLVDAEAFDYHPVEVALREILAVSRLGFDGVLCDDFAVMLDEVTSAVPCGQCGDPACALVAR